MGYLRTHRVLVTSSQGRVGNFKGCVHVAYFPQKKNVTDKITGKDTVNEKRQQVVASFL